MKSILITGASGFIGSHLVEEGLRRGFEVFAAVRKTSSRRYLADPRIRFLELDYSAPENLENQLLTLNAERVRFDFIVHNAGVTRADSKDAFNRINHLYTRHLVDALASTGLTPDKFIYISSLAAVGPGNPVTMEPISDTSVPNPVDAYGESKLAAERFLESTKDFPYLIIRPTGVYGPREKDYLAVYRNLNKGVEFYIGKANQRVSFLYITDLVQVIYAAMQSDLVRKTRVIADGQNYSVREFTSLVKQILGTKTVKVVVPLPVVRFLAGILELAGRPFGIVPLLNRDKLAVIASQNWQCDPSLMLREVNYSPGYSLELGLRETISWNRKHGFL